MSQSETKQKQIERIRKLYKYPARFFKEIGYKNPYIPSSNYTRNDIYHEKYNIFLDEKEKTGKITTKEIDFEIYFSEVKSINSKIVLQAENVNNAKKKFRMLSKTGLIKNYIKIKEEKKFLIKSLTLKK